MGDIILTRYDYIQVYIYAHCCQTVSPDLQNTSNQNQVLTKLFPNKVVTLLKTERIDLI